MNSDDTRLLSSFTKLDEVKAILNKLLAVDLIEKSTETDRSEVIGIWRLHGIVCFSTGFKFSPRDH